MCFILKYVNVLIMNETSIAFLLMHICLIIRFFIQFKRFLTAKYLRNSLLAEENFVCILQLSVTDMIVVLFV